jgi:hypothetical protein
MKPILKILLAVIIVFTGCVKYKTTDGSDIKNTFVLNSSPSFKGYYYMGSNDEYHFFIARWDLKRDKYFKIPKDSMFIKRTLRYSKKEQGTKIDVIGDSSKLFGETKYCKLFYNEK